MANATTTSRQPLSARPAQPKRNWLAEIKTEIKNRPTAAIIYGVPGVGKTSMAAHAPGCVFLCDEMEDGVTTLKASGLVPNVPQLPIPNTWGEVLSILDSLATDEHSFRTLVIDAMRGFEVLCHDDVCQNEFNGDRGEKGFESYQKGYSVAVTPWRLFLRALDRLRDERKMSIILLAHAKVVTFKNPGAADFDRYTPDVHAKTWEATNKWAEMVLFCNYLTVVKAKDDTKKGKGYGGRERFIYTEYDASRDAKNRYNLPEQISMGTSGFEAWTNLMDAIKAGRTVQPQE